jgi:hypothetical protein
MEVLMTLKKTVMLVGFVPAAVAVVALGSWLGTLYGDHRLREREVTQRSAQTVALQESVRGIRVGSPLPAVLAWSVNGERAFEIRQLLPEGGVFLLVSPGCDLCVEAAEKLQRAIASIKARSARAIILADQVGGSGELCHALEGRGISLQVYCDMQETFRRDYRVTANPAYFVLNKAGVVLDLGAGVPDESRLSVIFAQG